MKYMDIKQALYYSDAIAEIPDQWNISIPFLCKLDGKNYDTFLCTLEDKDAQLMGLLLVDCFTGRVRAMDAKIAADTFSLDTLRCEAEPIEDYDAYLAGKDRYEELYDRHHSDLIRDIPISEAAAAELGKLFFQTVGKAVINKLVGKITDDFFTLLSKSKQEQPPEQPNKQPQEVEMIENTKFPEE